MSPDRVTGGMATAPASLTSARPEGKPGAIVTAIGVLVALWCIVFAAVSAVIEVTGHLAAGPYGDYRSGFTVMNWFVFGLKIVGAAVAAGAIAPRPRIVPPSVLAVLVWGAFASLGVYALGSVVQAIGMASGLTGAPDQIDLAGVGYVLFFLLAAAGFGVLAVAHSRRNGLSRGPAVLGVCGAPILLCLVLLAVPALLAAFGLLPAP